MGLDFSVKPSQKASPDSNGAEKDPTSPCGKDQALDGELASGGGEAILETDGDTFGPPSLRGRGEQGEMLKRCSRSTGVWNGAAGGHCHSLPTLRLTLGWLLTSQGLGRPT